MGSKYQRDTTPVKVIKIDHAPTVTDTESDGCDKVEEDLNIRCGDFPSVVNQSERTGFSVQGTFWSPDCQHIAWYFLNDFPGGWIDENEQRDLSVNYQPNANEGIFVYDRNTNKVNKIFNPTFEVNYTIDGWINRTLLRYTVGSEKLVFNSTDNSPTPPPLKIIKDKLFLVKSIYNENANIYTELPKGSTIKYIESDGRDLSNYLTAEVTISGQIYAIRANSGGGGGPCPMGDENPMHCDYVDEKIDTPKDLAIEVVRIWRDDPRGVFLINPHSVRINDIYHVDGIQVSKKNPANGFTQKEIDTWTGIFRQIRMEKV